MKLSELLKYDDMIIQCHNFPDADTIASGYGLYCYLKQNGKSPRLVYGGAKRISKPNLLIMIERLEIPLEYAQTLGRKPQLIITADCVHGESNTADFEAETYAAVDHHKSALTDAPLYDIRPSYGSCSSLIAVLLREAGYNFNDNLSLATALYYGLYTDTGGLSEISFPADRDLRDFAKYDKSLITFLINSNMSLPELKIAGDAFNSVKCVEKFRFATVLTEECDPNILGFINDLVLQVDSIDVSVVCCKLSDGIKLSVRSCIDDINAAELANYITDKIGSGGGQPRKAGGFINYRMVKYAGTDMDISDPVPYVENKILEYCKYFDVIRADSFKPDTSFMQVYKKKPQIVGAVKSTDIFPAGTRFCIRTIEDDFFITASDDAYIIINKVGNLRVISGQRFESRYVPAETEFELKSEYDPRIISEDGTSRELMPLAKSCIRRSDTKIYASELKNRTKLYPLGSKDKYITGKTGDYLIASCEDAGDVRIVAKEYFGETYEAI